MVERETILIDVIFLKLDTIVIVLMSIITDGQNMGRYRTCKYICDRLLLSVRLLKYF